jgi:hypothetical protein
VVACGVSGQVAQQRSELRRNFAEGLIVVNWSLRWVLQVVVG